MGSTDHFYQQVVAVDQCLRVSRGLLADALPQLACEIRSADVEGARARIELAEAKLTDVRTALTAALFAVRTAELMVTTFGPALQVDHGDLLRLRPAGASAKAAFDLLFTCRGHLGAASRLLIGHLPDRYINAERLGAVGDLEAALQEVSAGAAVTSAVLRDAGRPLLKF